jgi:murein DD-endopeptidase MepM/ murein hydrolase activator NlpD
LRRSALRTLPAAAFTAGLLGLGLYLATPVGRPARAPALGPTPAMAPVGNGPAAGAPSPGLLRRLFQPESVAQADWVVGSVADGLAEESYRFGEERRILTVRPGDTLLGLLVGADIAAETAHDIVGAIGDAFDPRQLQIGQPITLVYAHSGRSRTLTGVSLMPDVDSEVVALRDADGSFTASATTLALETRPRVAGGDIASSLYADATAAGVPDAVLEDVLKQWAYAVDFQRDLHPGDRFVLLFEEEFHEDGRFARAGAVQMARLDLADKTIAMYRFEASDGTVDYYDRDGISARRVLMRTPIDGARLSSGFGARRHPILGYTRMHKGVDFAAPTGTPIYAAGDGTVEIVETERGFGKYIRIRHNGQLSTAYAHMSRFARLAPGARVEQGEIIGYVGSTGRSTGPHLHYEVLVDGAQVNPLSVDLPTGNRLEGRDLAAFHRRVEEIDRAIATEGSLPVASMP